MMKQARNKPFPFALYPILVASLVAIIGGIVYLGATCTGGSLTGDEVTNHAGSIEEFSQYFTRYASLENFKSKHNTAWKAMQKEKSFNIAQRDIFDAVEAIVEGDAAKLLKLTTKYQKVDFLPAYLLEANKKGVKEMVAYAEENGAEQAISKLMREKDDEDDKIDVWPYRAAFVKGLEKDLKYRKEEAQEVWDDSKASKEPNLFVEDPEVGLVSKRLLTKVEYPSTAGHLTAVKDLDGNPMIDAFGQPCLMRESYSRDMEAANECIFEKTKRTLVPYYCFRSAYMQAVVKSAIKGTSSFSMANIMGTIESRGNNQAASVGNSLHQWGAAFDSRSVDAEVIGDCLPSYWGQLASGKDPAHWEVRVSKPKKGDCTTVKLRGGSTRPFCFYSEKKEGEDEDEDELPPEGTYERVPEGELTEEDLVRVKATPEIKRMSDVIIKKENQHIDLEDVMDGALILFRYQADGKETFCKVEAHNNHKARGVLGWVSGRKSAKTAIYNLGCSTVRRK